MRSTLRSDERLRKRPEFQRVFDEGIRVSGRYLTFLMLPNGLGKSRLGVVATKKLGGAVRRNRAKRLIRELFRQHKPDHGLDLVVIARPETLDAPFAQLEKDFQSGLARRRSPSRRPPNPLGGGSAGRR